jgi:hypothetical protein
MPTNRRRSSESYGGSRSGDQDDSLRGGYTPFERIGVEAMYETPGVFNFSSLEEKYPTRQVVPMVPSYVRQEIDEERLAQKEKEVALMVRQAQLNNYDSELNEKNAISEQVIAARPEFALLNPQDEDFIEKSDQLFMKYPHLESSNDFMRGQFARLLRVHERAMNKKKPQTLKDLDDSYKIIQGIEQAADGREQTPEEKGLISLHKSKLSAGLKQQGVSMPLSFGTMQEAEEAERNNLLKKGDKVSIGGKTYIFE